MTSTAPATIGETTRVHNICSHDSPNAVSAIRRPTAQASHKDGNRSFHLSLLPTFIPLSDLPHTHFNSRNHFSNTRGTCQTVPNSSNSNDTYLNGIPEPFRCTSPLFPIAEEAEEGLLVFDRKRKRDETNLWVTPAKKWTAFYFNLSVFLYIINKVLFSIFLIEVVRLFVCEIETKLGRTSCNKIFEASTRAPRWPFALVEF